MRKFLLGLLLVLAACRSLPVEIANANTTANTETAALLAITEDQLLAKYNSDETKSPDELQAIQTELMARFYKVRDTRLIISRYLDSKGGDKDALLGYITANKILTDITGNSLKIIQLWHEWVDSANTNADRETFKVGLEKQIAEYKELDHKFQEWVKQFKVK